MATGVAHLLAPGRKLDLCAALIGMADVAAPPKPETDGGLATARSQHTGARRPATAGSRRPTTAGSARSARVEDGMPAAGSERPQGAAPEGGAAEEETPAHEAEEGEAEEEEEEEFPFAAYEVPQDRYRLENGHLVITDGFVTLSPGIKDRGVVEVGLPRGASCCSTASSRIYSAALSSQRRDGCRAQAPFGHRGGC